MASLKCVVCGAQEGLTLWYNDSFIYQILCEKPLCHVYKLPGLEKSIPITEKLEFPEPQKSEVVAVFVESGDNRLGTQIWTRVPHRVHVLVDLLADKLKTTKSDIVRAALERFIVDFVANHHNAHVVKALEYYQQHQKWPDEVKVQAPTPTVDSGTAAAAAVGTAPQVKYYKLLVDGEVNIAEVYPDGKAIAHAPTGSRIHTRFEEIKPYIVKEVSGLNFEE